MNTLIDFQTASIRGALETCKATKTAAESAIWTHWRVAMDFKASKSWQADYKSWEATCHANPDSLYSPSYYRTLSSAMPIAQAVELVSGEMLLPTQARQVQAKIHEIVPESERAPQFILAMLGLAYAAYPDAIVPAKNVLSEAYEVLKEERDNRSISYGDETFDYKSIAQVARLKERVGQDIAARSKWSKIAIEESRKRQLILRLARRLGYTAPSDSKKLLLSWED